MWGEPEGLWGEGWISEVIGGVVSGVSPGIVRNRVTLKLPVPSRRRIESARRLKIYLCSFSRDKIQKQETQEEANNKHLITAQ